MTPGNPGDHSEALIRFSLEGPNGEMLLAPQTESFSFHPATRQGRADCNSRTVHFTPKAPGAYTLHLRPLTLGIPKIHVRIEDPLKKDGKRISGY